MKRFAKLLFIMLFLLILVACTGATEESSVGDASQDSVFVMFYADS